MNTVRNPLPISVGVDTSEARTTTGVLHSAALARTLGAELRLVHASALPYEGVAFSPYEVQVARDEAAETLAAAAEIARRVAPDVGVTTRPVLGSATMALESASKDSSAVVVVRRESGRAERLLSGSTSSRVATHASCPVVVVPAWAKPSGGPVVVAIDADSPSHGALTFAFATARDADADLVVLHAVARGGTAQGKRGVGETLAGWRADYPEVEVTARTVERATVDACAEATRGARMLVLGRHRTTGSRLPWVRSVAKAVLARTTCPVVTVPHDAVDLAYRPRPSAMPAPAGPVY